MRYLNLGKILPYLGAGIGLFLAKEYLFINAETFTIMAFIVVFIAMKKYLSEAIAGELDVKRDAIQGSYRAAKEAEKAEAEEETLSMTQNHVKVDIMASMFEKGADLVEMTRLIIKNTKVDSLASKISHEMEITRNMCRQIQVSTAEHLLSIPDLREEEYNEEKYLKTEAGWKLKFELDQKLGRIPNYIPNDASLATKIEEEDEEYGEFVPEFDSLEEFWKIVEREYPNLPSHLDSDEVWNAWDEARLDAQLKEQQDAEEDDFIESIASTEPEEIELTTPEPVVPLNEPEEIKPITPEPEETGKGSRKKREKKQPVPTPVLETPSSEPETPKKRTRKAKITEPVVEIVKEEPKPRKSRAKKEKDL